MDAHSPAEVTQLLQAWSQGETSALEKLTPLVYKELHRLAHRYMSFENPGHTLQTTALVNEAYLRLVSNRANWQNRAHFFAISAQLMQQILVDFARSRQQRNTGNWLTITVCSGWRKKPLKRLREDSSSDLVPLDESRG